MSFVSIIRDYVEMLNQLSDSLGNDFTFKTFLLESFFYVLQTVKFTVFYILSFQWVRDFILLPTTIPSISSAIFRETFFLETPSKIFFEFLEIPSLEQNKFLLGFFNSFFFTLPISIIHIISVRRLIIQGIPAGVFSISGYLFGQFLFLICVIFGIRFILIPWLTFEPLNYILGLILIFRIIYPMVQEPLVPIRTWDWKNPKYQNFFLTSFALAWCEQTSIFQYLGNISISSNPTILEGFSTNSSIASLLSHTNYLSGILIGSILFTAAWGFLFIKLRDFIVSYTPVFKSSFMQILNKTTFILALAFTISSIPYYGLDYLFTGPLGFISQDRAFNNTIFSQYHLKDYSQYLGSFSQYESVEVDVAPFDRGRYLIVPNQSEPFSFEDLNYQGEADWITRADKLSGITEPKSASLAKLLKTKKSASTTLEQTPSDFKKFENINSISSEDKVERVSEISAFNDRVQKWYQFHFGEDSSSEDFRINDVFQNFTNFTFSNSFLRTDGMTEKDVQKKIKAKYYSNPVYKSLLALDIDLFLNRQPDKFKLNTSQENDLYTKRCILNSYYDSLRAYSKLPNVEEFENFFDGSKSFSNKVYNQQFKGTLRSVRRLFALTGELNNEDGSTKQPQVLKFDQPLYEFSAADKFSPYHEELPELKTSVNAALSTQSPFINDVLTRPLYAGWDENLRKFVITNKLLPRKTAGTEIKITAEMQTNFDSDPKTKNSKKNTISGSQKLKFTAWPLSLNQLDQPKHDVKIPYVTLFFTKSQLEDPDSELQQDFDVVPAMPSNKETLERNNAAVKTFDNLFDYLAPKRGGFVWPGNKTWDFFSSTKS